MCRLNASTLTMPTKCTPTWSVKRLRGRASSNTSPTTGFPSATHRSPNDWSRKAPMSQPLSPTKSRGSISGLLTGFIDPPDPWASRTQWESFLAELEGMPDSEQLRQAKAQAQDALQRIEDQSNSGS